jgi:hypothetical protein
LYKWGCEILDLIEHDRIEKLIITKVYVFKNDSKFDYFTKFIGEMYAQRVNYKKAGNKPMADVIKLILNSLYGKLAQKIFNEIRLLDGSDVDKFFLGEVQSLKNYIKFKHE